MPPTVTPEQLENYVRHLLTGAFSSPAACDRITDCAAFSALARALTFLGKHDAEKIAERLHGTVRLMPEHRLEWMIDAAEKPAAYMTTQVRDELIGDDSSNATAVRAVLDLHRPVPVYIECEHHHTEDEPGVHDVAEIGLVCDKGHVGAVCRECCMTDDGDPTDECGDEHPLGTCYPCQTVRHIAAAYGNDHESRAVVFVLDSEKQHRVSVEHANRYGLRVVDTIRPAGNPTVEQARAELFGAVMVVRAFGAGGWLIVPDVVLAELDVRPVEVTDALGDAHFALVHLAPAAQEVTR